jgi:hypothetical protein
VHPPSLSSGRCAPVSACLPPSHTNTHILSPSLSLSDTHTPSFPPSLPSSLSLSLSLSLSPSLSLPLSLSPSRHSTCVCVCARAWLESHATLESREVALATIDENSDAFRISEKFPEFLIRDNLVVLHLLRRDSCRRLQQLLRQSSSRHRHDIVLALQMPDLRTQKLELSFSIRRHDGHVVLYVHPGHAGGQPCRCRRPLLLPVVFSAVGQRPALRDAHRRSSAHRPHLPGQLPFWPCPAAFRASRAAIFFARRACTGSRVSLSSGKRTTVICS